MRGTSWSALRFGNNLRDYRRILDMSQDRLAMLAGLHRTEIGKLENGEREPKLLTIVKLAAVLQITPEALLDGIGWLVVVDASHGVVLIDGPTATGEPAGGGGSCR